jgi:hypothetical protein
MPALRPYTEGQRIIEFGLTTVSIRQLADRAATQSDRPDVSLGDLLGPWRRLASNVCTGKVRIGSCHTGRFHIRLTM